jgi:hypothetical protein
LVHKKFNIKFKRAFHSTAMAKNRKYRAKESFRSFSASVNEFDGC